MRICGWCGCYMEGDGFPLPLAPGVRVHLACAVEVTRMLQAESVEGERNARPETPKAE